MQWNITMEETDCPNKSVFKRKFLNPMLCIIVANNMKFLKTNSVWRASLQCCQGTFSWKLAPDSMMLRKKVFLNIIQIVQRTYVCLHLPRKVCENLQLSESWQSAETGKREMTKRKKVAHRLLEVSLRCPKTVYFYVRSKSVFAISRFFWSGGHWCWESLHMLKLSLVCCT